MPDPSRRAAEDDKGRIVGESSRSDGTLRLDLNDRRRCRAETAFTHGARRIRSAEGDVELLGWAGLRRALCVDLIRKLSRAIRDRIVDEALCARSADVFKRAVRADASRDLIDGAHRPARV